MFYPINAGCQAVSRGLKRRLKQSINVRFDSHMSHSTYCCKDLLSCGEGESPLHVVDLFDYYDGPVAGIMRCQHCSAVYSFEMLAWDKTFNTRILSLAPLPVDSVCEAVRQGLASTTEIGMRRILAQAAPVTMVVAWNQRTNQILAVKEPDDESRQEMSPLLDANAPDSNIDWFEYLNLDIDHW